MLLCLGLAVPAAADTFRPAYLQLTERDAETYDVRWKTPARDELTLLPVQPVFPKNSRFTQPLTSSYAGGTAVMTGRITVPGGLPGKELRFEGLTEGRGEVLVRFIRLDGSEELHKVLPVEPSLTIAVAPDSLGVSARYARLGIEHILLGFDHLLFVAALVMLVASIRTLIWTITSFTVAHSITLALVTLDVISVPVPPVEAFIALSIMFVAVEIVRQRQGMPSLASRKPWLVAFAFGLLHGLGFASALAEIGLPQNDIPLALLFFNVGVELGQIAFVASLLLLAGIARRIASLEQLRTASLAMAYAIGGLASYWLIDRITQFV
ncbi:MAG TPA: HupE/UreJ family protein [Sphingomicrobium sp.]|nr:HupE/UreJ family protein [Sphingomicrobium sp.]